MGYQERDREIVDYQLYELDETRIHARGPQQPAVETGEFIACIGAAQTFGAFCEHPYPALLQEKLDIPALNLGFGGVGPAFFENHPGMLDLLNRSRLVVIQVLSGRSVGNSLFESTGTDFLIRRSDGKKIAAQDAFQGLLQENLRWWKFRGRTYVAKVVGAFDQRTVKDLVRETRANYVREFESLLAKITAPKVLLWWSKRTPEYRERYDRIGNVFGDFPQLVNRPMVDALQKPCADYVECVTRRGSPQRLISRFTKEPVTIRHSDARPDLPSEPQTHNDYYPSPEMHEDAAAALLPVCRELLGSGQGVH